MQPPAIQPHNARAAAIWGSGGENYDDISSSISDAIEHCVTRLTPRPGQRVLDVATGTGWAARRCALHEASVTGIDLGADLVSAAKARALASRLTIDFQVGDAESLPFDDESFDSVISTFGVMFASDPEVAAGELARVCRKGGKLALTTWTADGTVAGLFKVMKPYMPASATPTPPSPFEWGHEKRIRALLGAAFELRFECGTTIFQAPTGLDAWELCLHGYGPTKTLAGALDSERREKLKRDFIAFHEGFMSNFGVAMPCEYLVTIGIRK